MTFKKSVLFRNLSQARAIQVSKDMIDDISFQSVDSNQDLHSLSFSLMCAAEMFVKNVVDWKT